MGSPTWPAGSSSQNSATAQRSPALPKAVADPSPGPPSRSHAPGRFHARSSANRGHPGAHRLPFSPAAARNVTAPHRPTWTSQCPTCPITASAPPPGDEPRGSSRLGEHRELIPADAGRRDVRVAGQVAARPGIGPTIVPSADRARQLHELGTTLGPHAMHPAEQPARRRTQRRATTPPLTTQTAKPMSWGSRGRRFKSSRPDC